MNNNYNDTVMNKQNCPPSQKNHNHSIPNNCDEKFDSDFFEIFGLKLYFDDILLICMIFFLYNEGVQDQMLFVALILLLIS